MSQYIMQPGSELMVGPSGKPYETLGSCCSRCAKGRPCATAGVGDMSKGLLAFLVIGGLIVWKSLK